MNLNDMPHSGVLVAAVSHGPVLFRQQARQFLQASLTGLAGAPESIPRACGRRDPEK
jgi:hypothetical protein